MTDGIEQWIVDLPVWLQVPLVLAVLVPVACGVAAVLTIVVGRIIPASEEERRMFADAASADAAGEASSEEGDPR